MLLRAPLAKLDGSRIITSIDVGHSNLGMVVARVNREWTLRKIEFFRKINLANLPHDAVSWEECELEHSNECSDRIDHFIQEYRTWFEESDVLLIERQPITGLKDVEQLLFKAHRKKAVLMSPNSMHVYFGIG